MDVEVKELPKSKLEIQIKLSGEEFSPYLTNGAMEVSKGLNIAGFRRGKAPLKMIEDKVGKKRILDEGAKIALNKIFSNIIKEKALEVLGKPVAQIQKLSQEGLEASIEVSILPKVELPPWRDIAKVEPWNKVKVEETEVEEALKRLQKSRAKFIRKTESAQNGDLIQIDYEIRSGGVKIENGDIKNQKFILGEGNLLPGFERKLIGIKENEDKEFSLDAPPDFWKKELRGKILDFKVKTKSVFKVELPKINDEWSRSLGRFDSLTHLRNSLREGIQMEKEEAEKRKWEGAVLEKISQRSKIDLPDILVEREKEQMIENFKMKIESMGLSFEDYLSHIKKSPEDLRTSFLPEAQKRVRILLSLYQIAREEEIKVNDQEIKEEINKILKKYPTTAKELQDKEKEQNFKAYLKENILQRKVLELLFLEAGQKRKTNHL